MGCDFHHSNKNQGLRLCFTHPRGSLDPTLRNTAVDSVECFVACKRNSVISSYLFHRREFFLAFHGQRTQVRLHVFQQFSHRFGACSRHFPFSVFQQTVTKRSAAANSWYGLNLSRWKLYEPPHKRPLTQIFSLPMSKIDDITDIHFSSPRTLDISHNSLYHLYKTTTTPVLQTSDLLANFGLKFGAFCFLHGKTEASDPTMPVLILTRHIDFRKQRPESGEKNCSVSWRPLNNEALCVMIISWTVWSLKNCFGWN